MRDKLEAQTGIPLLREGGRRKNPTAVCVPGCVCVLDFLSTSADPIATAVVLHRSETRRDSLGPTDTSVGANRPSVLAVAESRDVRAKFRVTEGSRMVAQDPMGSEIPDSDEETVAGSPENSAESTAAPTTLDQGRYGRVRDLYSRVADLAPNEREQVLSQARIEDAAVLEELGALLETFPSVSAEAHRRRSDAVLGDFQIEGRLGAGGMGIVYRARQLSLNRTVALKVLGVEQNGKPIWTDFGGRRRPRRSSTTPTSRGLIMWASTTERSTWRWSTSTVCRCERSSTHCGRQAGLTSRWETRFEGRRLSRARLPPCDSMRRSRSRRTAPPTTSVALRCPAPSASEEPLTWSPAAN